MKDIKVEQNDLDEIILAENNNLNMKSKNVCLK